jgi:hypothetical protein
MYAPTDYIMGQKEAQICSCKQADNRPCIYLICQLIISFLTITTCALFLTCSGLSNVVRGWCEGGWQRTEYLGHFHTPATRHVRLCFFTSLPTQKLFLSKKKNASKLSEKNRYVVNIFLS